jgi:hypothetical protein
VTTAARASREAHAIQYRRPVIKVLDRKKLEKLLCECYPVIRGSVEKGFRSIERD